MIALLLALVLTGQEPASDLPPDLITDPSWIAMPIGQDMARYIPDDARAGGGATVECRVDAKGWLRSCRVIAEDPPGQHWGKATIAVSTKFRAAPLSKSGQPTAGKLVRIPMRWNLPPND